MILGPLHVHVDAYSAMTGASLYTYQNPLWTYNRTESLAAPKDYDSFEVLVTHDPAFHSHCFDTVAEVTAFSGIQLSSDIKGSLRGLRLPVALKWEPLVAIVERKEACL